jgi:hypothetical protein
MTGSFLNEPQDSPQVQALFAEDLAEDGYVWNGSRLAAHQPDTMESLLELASRAFRPSGLRFANAASWSPRPPRHSEIPNARWPGAASSAKRQALISRPGS